MYTQFLRSAFSRSLTLVLALTALSLALYGCSDSTNDGSNMPLNDSAASANAPGGSGGGTPPPASGANDAAAAANAPK